MSFKVKLQALCDEENVKIVPGLVVESGAIRATLKAFKLDEQGQTQKQMDLGEIAPKRTERPKSAK